MKSLRSILAVFAMCGLCVIQAHPSLAQANVPRAFASPDTAVAALIEAVKGGKRQQVLAILGAGADELIESGDPVSDERDRKRFTTAFEVKNTIQQEGPDRAILEVGEDFFHFRYRLCGWDRDGYLMSRKENLLDK